MVLHIDPAAVKGHTMDPVFPENINIKRSAPRAVQLKHVLALVYICGGIGGVLGLLSKFVVSPLFEQLTFERRLLAQEMRVRQAKINIQIERMVTEVPEFETSNYKVAIVPARPRKTTLTPKEEEIKRKGEQYKGQLNDLSLLIREADPNNQIIDTTNQTIKQSEELLKYARQLQYDVKPAMNVPSFEEDMNTPLLKAVFEFKLAARAVKSAVLSNH